MCWFLWDATFFCNNFTHPKPVVGNSSPLLDESPFRKIYPSQTTILEGWTKDEIRMFEALFKGVSTRFGLRTIEKSVENPDFIFCSSFRNIRLGSMKLLQKIVATWDAICWFVWDAMIFCNNFTRWLQKIVATCDVLGFRVLVFMGVGFSGMLWSFVTALCSQTKIL